MVVILIYPTFDHWRLILKDLFYHPNKQLYVEMVFRYYAGRKRILGVFCILDLLPIVELV